MRCAQGHAALGDCRLLRMQGMTPTGTSMCVAMSLGDFTVQQVNAHLDKHRKRLAKEAATAMQVRQPPLAMWSHA